MAGIALPGPTGRASGGVRVSAAAWAAAVGRGMAVGVTLGITYRAWMRLISTEPEFTWSGTLFIVGSVTVVATLASVSEMTRRRWQRPVPRMLVRVIAGLSFILLASGPGLLTVPVWLPAGLAWGNPSWSRGARRVLWSVAGLTTAGVLITFASDFGGLGIVRSVVALPLFVAIMAVIAKLFTWPTADTRRVASMPFAALVAVVVLGAGVAARGVG